MHKSLKRKAWMAALAAMICTLITPPALIAAGVIDRGPQRTIVMVQDGTGEVTLIRAGGTARASIEAVLFVGASAATTQTVSLVSGGVTNTAMTKTVGTTDRLVAAANLPTLFAGDKLLITSSDSANTNKLPAYVIWKLID